RSTRTSTKPMCNRPAESNSRTSRTSEEETQMTSLFGYPDDREASNAAKGRALEALLIEKGVIGSDSVDTVLRHFETTAGPFNGAKIVARAWVDPEYKKRLTAHPPPAIAELDLPATGSEGEHMAAVANDDHVHNLIICT